MRLGIGAFTTALVCGCVLTAPGWAASGGDANAGDVWLDNAGQPAGPGHEMDPHLACADIVLYGAKLADSQGAFTIAGWPPSGSKRVDYSGSWAVQSGSQQIALIPISQLMAGVQASADTPAKQGYHFKLDFSQDPQKHKTFWVNCPRPSSGGGSTGGTPGGSSPPGTSTGSSPGTSTSAPTAGGTTTTKTSVKAVHKTRKKKLRRSKRHARAKRRHVKARRVARTPSFTG